MDKDHKRWEREAAKAVGGKRTGPLGFNVPDVTGTPGISIECKLQTRFQLTTKHLEQAKNNAREGTDWILALKKRNSKEKLAVMDFKLFVKLYSLYLEKETN